MARKTSATVMLLSALIWITAAVSVSAQQPWMNIPSPVTSDLTTVDFVSDQIGYIASRNGEILRTTDGGLNWAVVSQIENLGATSIDFIDPAHGWVAGNFNVPYDTAGIFETLDSGKTWIQQFQHIFYNFEEVQFLNDSTGWLAASEISESDTVSSLMYTTTRGFSWTKAPSPQIHNALYGVHMRDDNNGIAFGDHGIFFETTNGGMHPDGNWGMNIAIPAFGKTLYGGASSGATYGCVVGQDGFVLVTNNNWSSYQDHTVTSGDTLNSITGLSSIPKFYAVGNNGCIATIQYALFMWMINEETRVTPYHLNDICQVNDQNKWVVGDHGTILLQSNNYPPVAVDDVGSVRQDSSLKIFVLDNDTDMDFDPLEIYDYRDGNHGVLVHPDGEDYLEFYPDDDYVGMDTMWYVVTDGKLGFDTAHIYVEITEAPVGPFTEIRLEDIDLAFGSAIWGDVDNDDDYDIVVCGEQADGTRVTWFLQNDEGTFVKAPDVLEGVQSNSDRSMAFTDLDTDGTLDFIITGLNNDGKPFSQLYIFDFDQGKIAPYKTGIPGVSHGSVDWADFDNDGDPDLLIMGSTQSEKICHIYRNDGKSDQYRTWIFTKISYNFYGLDHGVARFVDFNRDHFTDVVITGLDEENAAIARSYGNDFGTFVPASLDGYTYSNLEVIDFNADGNVDLFFSGTMDDDVRRAGFMTYTDSFNELPSSLDGLSQGSASWGDFDNDGDPDLVVCGINNQLASETQLYVNNEGTLENSGYLMPGMASGTVEWGDYDADGDLDLLMSGYFNAEPHRSTLILRNDLENPNEAPEAPDQFVINSHNQFKALHWSPGRDQESQEEHLEYNFKLKRKKSYNYLIEPASDDSLILEIPGYASARDTMVYLDGLAKGMIYEIELQTVDAGFHVSPWAKFQFDITGRYYTEQDYDFNVSEILAAEWFYTDSESNPVLLLTERLDSAATLIQWTGTQFDTVARYPELGSGHGQLALLDFNMDNEVDFSEYDKADTSMVIYISSGDTLRVPIEYTVHQPEAIYDWGDYDGDGDPDLIIAGNISDEGIYASLYRNDGDHMVHLYTPIHNVAYGDIAWVDIDGDGDNDVVVTGHNKNLGLITRSYENRNGGFYLMQADLPGLTYSSFDFADYDHDGDMDMLLCGRGDDTMPLSKIYNNNNGVFSPTDDELVPNERGSCRWVDLNLDNWYDIVLVGYQGNFIYGDNSAATVYIYTKGIYDETERLEDVPTQHMAIADYDGDDLQDLVFAGETGGYSDIYIYKNRVFGFYKEFGSPPDFDMQACGDSAVLSWDYPEGIHRRFERVTFNLRIGTQPGGTELMSPLADVTGFRKVIRPGNIPAGNSWTLHGLSPDSIYYAAVQAVDLAFNGGPFTDEMIFNPISGAMIPGEVIYSPGPQVQNAVFVDSDSDGDPDLVINQGNSILLFENNNGTFDFETHTVLANGSFSDDILLVDPDKDNDADILLFSDDDSPAIHFLENTSGDFSAYSVDVGGLYHPDVAVGDINNDGTAELVIMGTEEPDASMRTLIYELNENGFESLSNLLVTTYKGEIHMIDEDIDGDLDLVRVGTTKAGSEDPADYELFYNMNVGGAFGESKSILTGLKYADMAFGDYDNNRYMDLLYSGSHPVTGMPKTYICKHKYPIYYPVDSSLVQVFNASAAWFDYNNDGLLDIVISGYNDTDDHYDDPDVHKFSGVYMNRDITFEVAARLPEFVNPIIAVADVDMDGKQDLFLSGHSTAGDTLGILYRNLTSQASIPPDIPVLDVPDEDDEGVHFSWYRKYFSSGNYNLRVGTAPGTGDVVSPLSHADGTRKVYDYGNVRSLGRIGYDEIPYTLVDLAPGTTYYAAVQAINKARFPSAWSNEVEFTTLGTGVVPDLSPSIDVHVYPVPAREELIVEVQPRLPGEIELGVIDPLGRELFRRRQHNDGGMTTFRVELPAGGLYLLRIRSGSDQVIRRVVVAE